MCGYGPRVHDDARCPNCGGELQRGRLVIRGTLGGFVLFGFSHQHLWWTDVDGTPASKERVIDSGNYRWARRCIACKTVVLPPDPHYP